MARHLHAIFDTEDGKQIFWDDVAILRKPDNYEIYVRPCMQEDIVEIDDFEDLQKVDPSYIVKKKAH